MSIFEILGGVELVVGDLLALLSLVGSVLLLLEALWRRARPPKRQDRQSRRSRRDDDQIWMWSTGGLIFGTALFICWKLTSTKPQPIGIFRLNEGTVVLLLAVSALLIFARLRLSPKQISR